jgi:hypothetical protein
MDVAFSVMIPALAFLDTLVCPLLRIEYSLTAVAAVKMKSIAHAAPLDRELSNPCQRQLVAPSSGTNEGICPY